MQNIEIAYQESHEPSLSLALALANNILFKFKINSLNLIPGDIFEVRIFHPLAHPLRPKIKLYSSSKLPNKEEILQSIEKNLTC